MSKKSPASFYDLAATESEMRGKVARPSYAWHGKVGRIAGQPNERRPR